MKNQEHKSISKPEQKRLFDEIKNNTYVKPEKTIILDFFFSAFEQDKLESNKQFVSFLYATGQKRHPKSDITLPIQAKNNKNKKFYSGPWKTISSIFSSKAPKQGRISGAFGNEGLMTMGQIREIAQAPLQEFATYLSGQTKNSQSDSQPETFQWLLMGHSRGGAIARYLASTQLRETKLADGTTVKIEVQKNQPDGAPPLHTATISHADQPQKKVSVDVQIDVIAFSATTGPNLKSEKGFTEIAARSHLDFLATGDGKQTRQLPPLFDLFSLADLVVSSFKNLYKYAYGRVMKPLNQRRTTNSGDTLFLHIPVNHPAITKADTNRILHMEVEVLTAYLNMRHLGYGDSINAGDLKIPFRNKNKNKKKWYEREKTTVELKNIELSGGKILSKASSTQDCINALQNKYEKMRAAEAYQNRSDYINVHGNTDRRFLVLRSGYYATAMEERLALSQQSIKEHEEKHLALAPDAITKLEAEKQILEKLFTGDSSPELKKFTQFAQHCLSKTGLNDPGLKNPDNLNKFLLLKTAAILKNEHFVIDLFNKIDEAFPSNKSSDALNLKNKILTFLEKQPVTIKAETAEENLIKHFLTKLISKNPEKQTKNIEKTAALKIIVFSILEPEELNSYIALQKKMKASLPGIIESQKKNINRKLDEIIEKLPKYLQEGSKEKALQEIFPTKQERTTTSQEIISQENPKFSPKTKAEEIPKYSNSLHTLMPPQTIATAEQEKHEEDNLLLSI